MIKDHCMIQLHHTTQMGHQRSPPAWGRAKNESIF